MSNYRWWVGIISTLIGMLVGSIWALENRYTTKDELKAFDQLEQARMHALAGDIADQVIHRLYEARKVGSHG